MADPITSLQNFAGMLQMSLEFTMNRIEDYHNVIPEAIKLSHECHLFQMIVKDVIDKPYLPINLIIQDVHKTMNETNDLIEKFLKRDARTDRPFIRNAAWKLRRIHAAYENRAMFRDATDYLRVSKENIKTNLALSAQLSTPTVHSFSNSMVNQESFAFWKDTCGEALHAPSWSLFIEAYQQRYHVFFDQTTLDRIKKVICRDEVNLTITGYALLTRLCDFPIDMNKLNALRHPVSLDANYYKRDMVNLASFTFWIVNFGEVVEIPDWMEFVTSYQQTYHVHYDRLRLERIQRVVRPDGTRMSITGYLRLTKLCGFPLELWKLRDMDAIVELADHNRLDITRKINALIARYASQEMRDALATIRQWYKGYERHNTEAWDQRAKDWATIVNRPAGNDQVHPVGKDELHLAQRVDIARKTYVSFFQAYEDIFEMDKISEKMFIEVDFPGKARIYEFLDFVKPLEQALYKVTPWGESTLFPFLESRVNEKKEEPFKLREKIDLQAVKRRLKAKR